MPKRLDLALMAQIAERLPLGAAPRALLADLSPRGVLSGLAARWEGTLEAPDSYHVKARLEDLHLDALPASQEHQIGRPGLSGASLQLEATEKGGQVDFAMADGQFEFPGLFEEPVLPLTEAAARLEWTIEPGHGEKNPARYSPQGAEPDAEQCRPARQLRRQLAVRLRPPRQQTTTTPRSNCPASSS